MKTLKAKSISEAFELALQLFESWGEGDPPLFWFRGSKDNGLSLTPGAYWRPDYKEIEPLITFSQEGVAYCDVGSLYDWHTYYLAQHHGIPTRLLDWTESFSAALFFAFDGWNGKSIPCIWIMQPCKLNEVFLNWFGIIAPENYAETSIWLPRTVEKISHAMRQDELGYIYDNRWPLAIYPKKSNARITAQQGAFTVHGRNKDALDKLVKNFGGNPTEVFARIDLTSFSRDHVQRDLALLGIRRSAVYPDVDNFVRRIREEYGW